MGKYWVGCSHTVPMVGVWISDWETVLKYVNSAGTYGILKISSIGHKYMKNRSVTKIVRSAYINLDGTSVGGCGVDECGGCCAFGCSSVDECNVVDCGVGVTGVGGCY